MSLSISAADRCRDDAGGAKPNLVYNAGVPASLNSGINLAGSVPAELSPESARSAHAPGARCSDSDPDLTNVPISVRHRADALSAALVPVSRFAVINLQRFWRVCEGRFSRALCVLSRLPLRTRCSSWGRAPARQSGARRTTRYRIGARRANFARAAEGCTRTRTASRRCRCARPRSRGRPCREREVRRQLGVRCPSGSGGGAGALIFEVRAYALMQQEVHRRCRTAVDLRRIERTQRMVPWEKSTRQASATARARSSFDRCLPPRLPATS
jgi:hypothetical protein